MVERGLKNSERVRGKDVIERERERERESRNETDDEKHVHMLFKKMAERLN